MSDAELAVKFLQVAVKQAGWRDTVAKGVVGAADNVSGWLGRAGGAAQRGAAALPDMARSAVNAPPREAWQKFLASMQSRFNDPARMKDMAVGGGVGAGVGALVSSAINGAQQTGQQISDVVVPKQAFVAGAVSGLNTVANKGSVGAGAVGALTSETGAQLGAVGGGTLAALLGELIGSKLSPTAKGNIAGGGALAGYGVGGYLGHRLANSQLRDSKDRENRQITG